MDWIKVNERKPEPIYGAQGARPIISADVLAYWPEVESPYGVANYDHEENSWTMIDGLHTADCEPTHWMPLPDKPQS